MDIKRLYIYGFGKWSNKELLFSEGLNCIYGNNEAGKSTIHQAIIYILFGLNSKLREQYKPKVGPNMGGQLVIEQISGINFTIERQEGVRNGQATCYLKNGDQKDEIWLKKQFTGMTAETYKKIFSYSVLDVDRGVDFKEADLGEMILSIGLTGATDIQMFERKLEMSLGNIFKPSGKKPKINTQLVSLEHLQKKIHQDELEVNNYHNLIKYIESAQERLDEITEQRDHLIQEERITERKLQAISIIQSLQHNTNERERLPNQITFPPSGKERLERLNETILPIESELSVILNELMKVQEHYRDLKKTMPEKEARNHVVELFDTIVNYEDLYKEKENKIEQLTKTQEKIVDQLEHLNIDIISEQLNQIQFTFYTQNEWNDLINQQELLRKKREQLQEKSNQISKEKTFYIEQLTQLEIDQNKFRESKEVNSIDENKAYKVNPKQLYLTGVITMVLFIIGITMKKFIYLYSSGAGILLIIFIVFHQLNKKNILQSQKIYDTTSETIIKQSILDCSESLKELNIAKI